MLRNFIFWLRSKDFNTYKHTAFSDFQHTHPEMYQEYTQAEPALSSLLQTTVYWHGTGRYQYTVHGTSKYEGVSKQDTFDVLGKIIQDGGLKPHYDPWAEKYVKIPTSISLANQWAYGKMYAHYHLDEQRALAYEIAPISFWYKVIIWVQLTEHYCKFALGFLIWYTLSDSLQKQGKVWLSSFRSDTHKKWPFWKILTAQSDISGNYSLLFGIKNCLTPLQIPTILRFLETRTDRKISFADITFIAVPYDCVEETQKLLLNHDVSVHTVPLEFIELFMRRYSLKEIMTQSYRTGANTA